MAQKSNASSSLPGYPLYLYSTPAYFKLRQSYVGKNDFCTSNGFGLCTYPHLISILNKTAGVDSETARGYSLDKQTGGFDRRI